MMLAGCSVSDSQIRPPLTRAIPDAPPSCTDKVSGDPVPVEGGDGVLYAAEEKAGKLAERRARANCAAAWGAAQAKLAGGQK